MAPVDSEAVRASARLGSVLRGKYRLDRVLGVGGMAAVYAATHRNGMEMAVKVLHRELAHRDDIRERFVREGRAANALKHPGAVAVLDDDVAEDGAAFLVMELLRGETLEAVWERSARKLALDTVIAMGCQLCDVLAAAHARGIVHRDIKPQNLFLTVDGELKVLDFGIARLREASTPNATTTGMMLGTPTFMSPEQAAGIVEAVGARSDLYGVGATLFTLASGAFIHEGDNAQQVVVKTATQPARSLGAVMPGLPRAFVDVVDRALAFDPSGRWPSAAAMRDALRHVYVDLYGPMPEAIPLPPLTGLAWFRSDDAPPSLSNQTTAVPVAIVRDAPADPAVAASAAASSATVSSSRGRARTLAGAAAIALLASAVTYGASHRASSPANAVAAASAPPPPAVELVAPAAPAASAASPAAATTPSAAPSSLPSAEVPAAAPPHPSARARAAGVDCNPPYTVDAHGMHHWKLACL
jgi:serine/threonine-protein kinase